MVEHYPAYTSARINLHGAPAIAFILQSEFFTSQSFGKFGERHVAHAQAKRYEHRLTCRFSQRADASFLSLSSPIAVQVL